MNTARELLDVYLEVNALIFFAFVLCITLALGLRVTGRNSATTCQLRVSLALLVAAFASPIILALAGRLSDAQGAVASGYAPNLMDFLVSRYLQGRLSVEPSVLENFLSLRTRMAGEILNPSSQALVILISGLAAGALFCAIRLALSVRTLFGIVRDSYLWRSSGRVELRFSDAVTVPFSTRSLTRRYVILPVGLLENPRDLRIVVAHEFEHLRQGDVEWEIALEIVRPFVFWNPAFYLWKRRVERLRELSCDRTVLSRRRFGVGDYCRCLLRVSRDSRRPLEKCVSGAPVVALLRSESARFSRRSAGLLKDRLVSLIDGSEERHHRLKFAVAAIPLVSITLLASAAIQKPADWSQDRLMLTTIVNLKRLAERTTPTAFAPTYLND